MTPTPLQLHPRNWSTIRNIARPDCGRITNVQYRSRQRNFRCAKSEGCGRIFTRDEVERAKAEREKV